MLAPLEDVCQEIATTQPCADDLSIRNIVHSIRIDSATKTHKETGLQMALHTSSHLGGRISSELNLQNLKLIRKFKCHFVVTIFGNVNGQARLVDTAVFLGQFVFRRLFCQCAFGFPVFLRTHGIRIG